jgi:hypothetical protein
MDFDVAWPSICRRLRRNLPSLCASQCKNIASSRPFKIQQAKLQTVIEAQDKQIHQMQADTTLSDTQKKEKVASIRPHADRAATDRNAEAAVYADEGNSNANPSGAGPQ